MRSDQAGLERSKGATNFGHACEYANVGGPRLSAGILKCLENSFVVCTTQVNQGSGDILYTKDEGAGLGWMGVQGRALGFLAARVWGGLVV